MNAPILSFRSSVSPYPILSSITYVQTKDGGSSLPVLQNEKSDPVYFRIYNNWNSIPSVATAENCEITTYDGIGVASHTAISSPVFQMWLHTQLYGYGENSSQPGLYSRYDGEDTPIGNTSTYKPEKGSDGGGTPISIRAGSDTNGVGFIEIKSYVSVPFKKSTELYTNDVIEVGMSTQMCAISMSYDYYS